MSAVRKRANELVIGGITRRRGYSTNPVPEHHGSINHNLFHHSLLSSDTKMIIG